jgi:Pyruvate/2-oxoacid:ferredoxin oxidoreductase delta subunit
MDWDWNLIQPQCTGCGICADLCPDAAIRLTRAMAYPEGVPGKCMGCGICVTECPFAAIEVRPKPAADCVSQCG